MHVPPSNCPIIGVGRENVVVDDHHVVYVHHVPHKDVNLLDDILRVHVVYAHAVVETSDYQLLSDHLTAVHWDLIAMHLILVPEEDQLVLIAS